MAMENETSRRARMIQDFRGSQMRHGDFLRKRQELMQRPQTPGAQDGIRGVPAPVAPPPAPAVQAPRAGVPAPMPTRQVAGPGQMIPGAPPPQVGFGAGSAPANARQLPQAPMPAVMAPGSLGPRPAFLGLPGPPPVVGGQYAAQPALSAQVGQQNQNQLNQLQGLNASMGAAQNQQNQIQGLNASMGGAIGAAVPVAPTQEQIMADAIRAQNAKQQAAASGLNASMNAAVNTANAAIR